MRTLKARRQESSSTTDTHRFVKIGVFVIIGFSLYTANTESAFMRSLSSGITDAAARTANSLLESNAAYAGTQASEAQNSEAASKPATSMFDQAASHVYATILQEQNETLEQGENNKVLDLDTWTTRTGGGLEDPDRKLLSEIYNNATSVFEYGVGESTYIANHMGVARYAGVDSHPGYLNDVRSKVSQKFRFYYGDVGEVGDWGHPKDKDLTKIIWQYQVAPLYAEPEPFDVYLVDGRYRMACVLFSFLHASARGAKHEDTTVMIHDCWRDYYHANDDILDLATASRNPNNKNQLMLCVYKRGANTTDEMLLERYEKIKLDPG